MQLTASRRPFGVSLLSILVIVGGALDVLAGIISISARGDGDLLVGDGIEERRGGGDVVVPGYCRHRLEGVAEPQGHQDRHRRGPQR